MSDVKEMKAAWLNVITLGEKLVVLWDLKALWE